MLPVPVVQTNVVSTTRLPVSQGESLNDLAVTVESTPTSAYHLLASAIQISHSMRTRFLNQCLGTGTKFLTRSRNESIYVCSVWSQYGDFRVAVASRVPDHHSPLPSTCETCTWLPRSYSGLFYERHRDSEDNWPMHERCRENSRVALPIRRGFHDSSSSQ